MLDLFKKIEEQERLVNLKKPAITPKGNVRRYEKVIGTLSDPLRRLYIATFVVGEELLTPKQCDQIHKKIDEISKKFSSSKTYSSQDVAMIQNHMLDHRVRELLQSYLWIKIEREFVETLILDNNIGLRKGWKVITWRDGDRFLSDLQADFDNFSQRN